MGQHMPSTYFMSFDEFKKAVDSMKGYPKMTGMMGGEPLLHPQFPEFCEYMRETLGRDHLGLWTALPVGYEDYAPIICKTFKYVFLNDHTRPDIYHHPFLVGIQEIIHNTDEMFYHINNCFFQHSWSASINPNGAFFCEIAAVFALLFNVKGWDVEPGWWWRTPKDFKEQIERFCPFCGGAVPLKRRSSLDSVDDISPVNYNMLKGTSPKIKSGLFVIHDLTISDCLEPLAAYKDLAYRDRIAARYGMYLTITPDGFWEPHLGEKPTPMFEKLKSWY